MSDALVPVRYPRQDLHDREGLITRRIGPHPPARWTEPRFFEWQLTGQSWTDHHLHSEYVYVLEGRLFVESGGVVVACAAGDLVEVPAGAVGTYRAPDHARMLSIYGPNPTGATSPLPARLQALAGVTEPPGPPPP